MSSSRPESATERVSFDAVLASDRIFLTGATGVLGSHLLKQLLRSTKATIYCLVRANTPQGGKRRLHSLLKVYDPDDTLGKEFAKRVIPVIGDVVDERLQLPDEKYEELAKVIDVTIHSAASTNLFSTVSQIAPINVGGTANMIRFALKTRQKYLCYVSTYTVMGSKIFDPSFVFRETDLEVGQTFRAMTYQHTKYHAEKLVHDASAEGLVWNIFRPGHIFGESDTGLYPQGQTNVSGLFFDIFKTAIETGFTSDCQVFYDITPVDYISRAMVYLALNRNSYYETYHLTNPDRKSYGEIMSLLAEIGYSIRQVPHAEFARVLLDGGIRKDGTVYQSPATRAFRYWFQRESFDFSDSAFVDCSYTRSILEPHGIICPKIDANLIKTYLKHAVEGGLLPVPPGLAAVVSETRYPIPDTRDPNEVAP